MGKQENIFLFVPNLIGKLLWIIVNIELIPIIYLYSIFNPNSLTQMTYCVILIYKFHRSHVL